jgi:hypothetical protein
LIRGHLIRGRLAGLDALYQEIAPGWLTLHEKMKHSP